MTRAAAPGGGRTARGPGAIPCFAIGGFSADEN